MFLSREVSNSFHLILFLSRSQIPERTSDRNLTDEATPPRAIALVLSVGGFRIGPSAVVGSRRWVAVRCERCDGAGREVAPRQWGEPEHRPAADARRSAAMKFPSFVGLHLCLSDSRIVTVSKVVIIPRRGKTYVEIYFMLIFWDFWIFFPPAVNFFSKE